MRGRSEAHIPDLRRRFFGGQPIGNALEPVIVRSWTRCRDNRLAPETEVDAEPVAATELSLARERAARFAALAAPRTEMLHSLIAGSNAMVLLADAAGTVIDASGDSDIVERAQQVTLSAGANWAEENKGTNAIGTALFERRAVEVHGAEHYFDRLGFLTCACAPIFDPYGQTVGALDITSHSELRQAHTLGLVTLTAELIEQQMFRGAFPQDIVIQFHHSAQSIGAPGSAIMVLREDGCIKAMNRHALAALGAGRSDIGRLRLEDVAENAVADFHAQAMASDGAPIALQLHSGQAMSARAEVSYARLRGRMVEARPLARGTERARPLFADLDTGDVQIAAMLSRLRRVIDRDIPVLVEGETGVGKELLARAIHNESARASAHFVAINCAAIPESLIESELFGYTPGAFTGADRKGAPGRIREADGGTLFLDEIGDMHPALQTRLLRVLEERRVTPVGGGPGHAVDVALVAATNADLEAKVRSGGFRADLFHRLAGFRVTLPPLRDRTDFRAIAARVLAGEGGGHLALSATAEAALLNYDWPGNIRELRNVLKTAAALADGSEITQDCLPPHVTTAEKGEMPDALTRLKRKTIAEAIARHNGNMAAAARELGLSRTTLYKYKDERH